MYPSIEPPPPGHIECQLASQLSRLTSPVCTIELPVSDDICVLKPALDILTHSCISCWLLQRQPEHNHLLKDCPCKPNPTTTIIANWSVWYQCIFFTPKGIVMNVVVLSM